MLNVQRFITRMPEKYRTEFAAKIIHETSFIILVASVLVTVFEVILFIFFRGSIFNTGPIVIGFILFNMLYLPVLWTIYKQNQQWNKYIVRLILFFYLSVLLLFTVALSILPQNQFASINPYIIGIFGVSAFIVAPPVASFTLYLISYLFFFFLLPIFQYNSQAVEILRINAFLMIIMAWFLSRMVYRLKLVTFMDKKALEESNLNLQNMVMRDSMTLLLNHKNIFLRLTEEIERAKRIGYPLSVVMLDIDHFKVINDNYGHQAGDEVILQVTEILNETCRATDVIGRYGGDEFVVILPDTNAGQALILAERIRQKVVEAEFDKGIQVSISGGIRELGDESADQLIKGVDEQLYQAKSKGRNRFEIMEFL